MIDEPTQERAALYALGLLDREEAAGFAAHLQSSPELQQLVADFEESLAQVALDSPQHAPPPELKRRILAQISGEQPAPTARRSAMSWVGWAAAAVLLAGNLFQLSERKRLDSQVTSLQQRDYLARVEIVRLRSKLEGDPSAEAVAMWDGERQQGVLDVGQLPPVAADKDYQLWIIDPAYKDPVDGGVIPQNATGSKRYPFSPKQPVQKLTKLAVSVEKQGGEPIKGRGPIVLISE